MSPANERPPVARRSKAHCFAGFGGCRRRGLCQFHRRLGLLSSLVPSSLVLSVAFLGCGGPDPSPASCGESPAVTLALSSRVDVPFDLPPRALVRTGLGFLALNQSGDSLVWFSGADGTTAALAVPGLRGLVSCGFRIIGFDDSQLFSLAPGGVEPLSSPGDMSTSSIRSVQISNEQEPYFWVLANQGDEISLYLLRSRAGKVSDPLGRWPIKGNWRVAPTAGGGVIAS